MKKMRFLFLLLAALAVSGSAGAQSGIFGKKENLRDIGEKCLKVVTDNNSFFNLSLKEAVEKNWKLCDVEFCTSEQFEELKCDTSYYFLMKVDGIFKKEREPAMEFLSLLKGGEEAQVSIENMYEVLTLPLNPIDDDGSYIVPYLDAYINIIQTHVLRVQKKKVAAVMGISWYSNRLSEIGGMRLLVNENDLSKEVTAEQAEEILGPNGSVEDEDTVHEAIDSASENTLVSLCVAPQLGQQGSYCYKMLIGTETGELFYYRKQKITGKSPKGFLAEDLKKIAVYLKQPLSDE